MLTHTCLGSACSLILVVALGNYEYELVAAAAAKWLELVTGGT